MCRLSEHYFCPRLAPAELAASAVTALRNTSVKRKLQSYAMQIDVLTSGAVIERVVAIVPGVSVHVGRLEDVESVLGGRDEAVRDLLVPVQLLDLLLALVHEEELRRNLLL